MYVCVFLNLSKISDWDLAEIWKDTNILPRLPTSCQDLYGHKQEWQDLTTIFILLTFARISQRSRWNCLPCWEWQYLLVKFVASFWLLRSHRDIKIFAAKKLTVISVTIFHRNTLFLGGILVVRGLNSINCYIYNDVINDNYAKLNFIQHCKT